MKPNQLVIVLRRIASNIERSKNPDRNLVARDLKKVVATLTSYDVKLKDKDETKMPLDAVDKFLRENQNNEADILINGNYILFFINDDGVAYGSDLDGVSGGGYDSVDDAVHDASKQVMQVTNSKVASSSGYYVTKNWGRPQKMSNEEIELYIMRRTTNKAIILIPGYTITLSMDNHSPFIHYLVNSVDLRRCGIAYGEARDIDDAVSRAMGALKSQKLI
jgi:hypothetical protein